jgi:hypothetical protein
MERILGVAHDPPDAVRKSQVKQSNAAAPSHPLVTQRSYCNRLETFFGLLRRFGILVPKGHRP